jgi:hypothetical protein
MLKDIHKDQIQPCRRKKQYYLTFAECFLDKYKPLMQISVLQKHQSLAG